MLNIREINTGLPVLPFGELQVDGEIVRIEDKSSPWIAHKVHLAIAAAADVLIHNIQSGFYLSRTGQTLRPHSIKISIFVSNEPWDIHWGAFAIDNSSSLPWGPLKPHADWDKPGHEVLRDLAHEVAERAQRHPFESVIFEYVADTGQFSNHQLLQLRSRAIAIGAPKVVSHADG
jgi:hypothetical protein